MSDIPLEFPPCNFCGGGIVDIRIVLHKAKSTEYDLVECPRCHLRWIYPRPQWGWVREKLWSPYNKEALAAEARNYLEQGQLVGKAKDPHAQIEWLQEFYWGKYLKARSIFGSREPKSMFEVGGSVGWLSLVCKAQGVPIVDGCEINEEAVKIANNEMGLSGHIAGDFNEYLPARKYDWVVMFDYIEHTWNPTKSLQQAYDMTESGGLLLLKTFLEDLDADRTMLDPPWHAYYFFGDVLYGALRKIGYKIRLWETVGCHVFLVGQKE